MSHQIYTNTITKNISDKSAVLHHLSFSPIHLLYQNLCNIYIHHKSDGTKYYIDEEGVKHTGSENEEWVF